MAGKKLHFSPCRNASDVKEKFDPSDCIGRRLADADIVVVVQEGAYICHPKEPETAMRK